MLQMFVVDDENLAPGVKLFVLSANDDFAALKSTLGPNVREHIAKPFTRGFMRALLAEYKQGAAAGADCIADMIFLALRARDFEGIYYNISGFVSEIYLSAQGGDVGALKEILAALGQRILNYPDEHEAGGVKCADLFPLDIILLSEPILAEHWLSEIINYVFVKQSIKRYQILESVLSYIDRNIHKNISLCDIVKDCNISQGYLSRIFKSQFNVSVMEYIHMRKLTQAKAYMAFTELNASDIAYRLGYDDSGYFGKVFKRYEKTTVHQYRIARKKTLVNA